MQKEVLERFIAKYNLAGAAESVDWVSDGTKLTTRFISDDKNVLGEIATPDLEFEAGTYSIFNTADLRSLIGVLDTDVKLKIGKKKEVPISLTFRDTATKVTFVLSQQDSIPDVPGIKTLPPFDVEIKLDEKFMTTFVKGKSALPDVETFTVLTEGAKTSIVLGYSPTLNSNRVAFKADLIAGDGLEQPVNFSAPFMKDILLANKEASSGVLKVSAAGLAHISFDIDGFTVNYYLVAITTK